MEFLYNVDFLNTDFINNDLLVLTLGLGTTLFFGSLIYFKFFKNNDTFGGSDNDSVPSSIEILDNVSSTARDISIKTIKDGYDDLDSNISTFYHSIPEETVKGNNMVEIGVNTEYSDFFLSNWFNIVLDWYRSYGVPSIPVSSDAIDSNMKLEHLNRYLDEFNKMKFSVNNSPVHSNINSDALSIITSSDIKFSDVSQENIISNITDNSGNSSITGANVPLPDSIINSSISNLNISDGIISPVNVPLPDSLGSSPITTSLDLFINDDTIISLLNNYSLVLDIGPVDYNFILGSTGII